MASESAAPTPLAIPLSVGVTADRPYWDEPEAYLVEGVVWFPDEPGEEPWVEILDAGEDDLDAEGLIRLLGARYLADYLIDKAVCRAEHLGFLCHGCGRQSHRCDCGDTCASCGAKGPWDRVPRRSGWRCRACGAVDDEPRHAAVGGAR